MSGGLSSFIVAYQGARTTRLTPEALEQELADLYAKIAVEPPVLVVSVERYELLKKIDHYWRQFALPHYVGARKLRFVRRRGRVTLAPWRRL